MWRLQVIIMKIIEDINEIILAISESNIRPKNSLTSTNYPDSVAFECGCGNFHSVNEPSLNIFGVSMPVKFCFVCENDYVCFVQVKGFFKPKATPLWSCKGKMFQEAIDKLASKT